MRYRSPAARLGAVLSGVAVLATPASALAGPPAADPLAPVVVETHVEHAAPARAGTPRGVVAHLFDQADEPLPGQPVHLYGRRYDGAVWTLAGEATTDAHGAATFAVAAPAAMVYVAKHPGSVTTAPASGPEVQYLTRPTPAPPAAPWQAHADPADGAAHVVWLPPDDDGGSPLTGYDVTVRPYERPAEAVTVTVSPDAREVTVPDLDNGRTYEVAVAATNALGSAATWTLVTPRADAPPWPAEPAGGTKVCGRLPLGTTTWTAAGSPYRVCRFGVFLRAGSTLEVTGAEVRFAASVPRRYEDTLLPGITVYGGGLHVTDSVLRGEEGRPGEWGGIAADRFNTPGWHWPTPGRTSSTVSLLRSEVRHAADAVRMHERASYLDLADTTLADGSGAGLRADGMPARLRDVTVSDVGGDGLALTCRAPGPAGTPCPVRVDTATVTRAAGRGFLLDTPGPAAVRGVTVTGSGTRAPVSEAARVTTLTGTYGAGGDVEDVAGGGNGVDAVLLDMTHTRDLTWRTPVAGSAAAPAPLGFLAGRVVMAPGRSVAFPPGSVVKAVEALPERPECYAAHFTPDCRATVRVTDGTLDAAPGTVFTSAHDAAAGLATCPSAFATSCGTGTSWVGLSVNGGRAAATLTGATVRYARYGLVVDGYQPAGGPGVTATVTGTTFTGGGEALTVRGSYDGPTGALTATDVTVERPSLSSVRAYALAAITLRRVTVRDAPDGVRLDGTDGGDGGETCVPRTAVTIDGLVVEDVRRRPVELLEVCHPSVRGVTVRRSAPAAGGEPVAPPAVDLRGTYSVGPGRDVDGFAGAGNGMDAVSLSGTVTGDLAWVSPRNAPTDHPLGYVLGPGPENLTVRAGTVTVPANALVASLGLLGYGNANGLLHLRDAGLDASAGGARFVSARDPLAAELGCAPCATTQWGGIRAVGVTEAQPTRAVRLHAATVRGGYLRTASPLPLFSVTQTTSDQPMFVRRPDRLVVTDSRLPQVEVQGALRADVSRNTFPGPYSGVLLYGRGRTAPSDLTLRDNVADDSIQGPAYVLGNAHVRLGAAGTVHGNLGTGDSAALMLAGVTTAHDVTWLSPTNEPYPHPVGYLAAAHEGDLAEPFAVEGPRTLTLPAGAVLKGVGAVMLRGARLDATAGGALVTPIHDGSAGFGCGTGWRHTCQDPHDGHLAGVLRVESVPDPATGQAGGIALRRARVHGAVRVSGPAGDAPGAPGYGLAVDASYLGGGADVTTASASLTRSRVRNAGVLLFATNRGPHLVRDTTFEDVDGTGLAVIAAAATVTESAFVRTARTEVSERTSAVQVWNGAVALSCLDVRGNGNGLRAHGQRAFTVTDSALAGNTGSRPQTYDLDNEVEVTTSRVWWGQSGGPRPAQVRDRDLHTDTAPAAARPACAVAESATPPSAPLDVTATGGDNAITARWAAPADDGGAPVSEYRVTVTPGGTTRYVPASARSVTVGVVPGTAYAVSVTAVNAAGAGTPSRHSAPAHAGVAGLPPTPATLSAQAPALVTYGTDAVVSGTLATAQGPLAGRLVEVRVRRAGTTSWGPPVATLVTSASGAVTHPLRPAANSEVLLVFAGDATALAASSPARAVAVRPVVPAAFSRTSIRLGESATLTGRVAPNLAGRRVRLERYTAAGWKGTGLSATLSATSAYRFTVRPGLRGTLSYRVVYDATAGHARAVSATRVLRVS